MSDALKTLIGAAADHPLTRANAEAAFEILFNGEEINVLPRIRDDNTARLKIGG